MAPAIEPSAAHSPPVLDYQPPQPPGESRWLGAVLLVLSLPLAVAPFVNLTFAVSPLYAVDYVYWKLRERNPDETLYLGLLAAVFFLGIPIVLWQLRLLIWRRSTRLERAIAHALGALAAAMTSVFVARWLIQAWQYSPSRDDWIMIGSCPLVLILGGLLLWIVRRTNPPAHALPTICLHTAYLANAALCLVGFKDERDPGWWLCVIGSCGLVAELLVILIQALQRGRAPRASSLTQTPPCDNT